MKFFLIIALISVTTLVADSEIDTHQSNQIETAEAAPQNDLAPNTDKSSISTATDEFEGIEPKIDLQDESLAEKDEPAINPETATAEADFSFSDDTKEQDAAMVTTQQETSVSNESIEPEITEPLAAPLPEVAHEKTEEVALETINNNTADADDDESTEGAPDQDFDEEELDFGPYFGIPAEADSN